MSPGEPLGFSHMVPGGQSPAAHEAGLQGQSRLPASAAKVLSSGSRERTYAMPPPFWSGPSLAPVLGNILFLKVKTSLNELF